MTRKKKQIAAAAILLAVVLAMGLLYYFQRPAGQAGEKTLQIAVISGESQKSFTIETMQEFLGAALLESGLAQGDEGPYGLYITTVDGIQADDAKNEWWALTRNGEMLDTGADATPIADGEQYELTLSTY